MITNLFSVSYLTLLFISLIVGIGAVVVGLAVGLRWKPESSSEKQHALEKKAYLSISLINIGFWIRLLMVPLWFFMLISFIPSLPGAMCMTGVHRAVGTLSFIDTGMKFIMPLFYLFWLLINWLDRSLKKQSFMRFKLLLLAPLGLIMLLEVVLDSVFIFSLEPRQTSCCVSLFDFPSENVPKVLTENVWLWLILFFILSVVIVALHFAPQRNAILRRLNYLLIPTNFVFFILALHTKISPFKLKAPYHHCVFCLWQRCWEMPFITVVVVIGLWLLLAGSIIKNLARSKDVENKIENQLAIIERWGAAVFVVGVISLAISLMIIKSLR